MKTNTELSEKVLVGLKKDMKEFPLVSQARNTMFHRNGER